MRVIHTKIITISIAGIVFTAGLIAGFGGYVFAGDPVPGLDITIEQIPGGGVSTKSYSSSLSNKSPGQIRKEVGDILLGYGVGGADINKVTDALEGGGVYEAELESFLIAIGINDGATSGVGSGSGGGGGAGKVKAILLEFNKLGIASDSVGAGSAVSAPSTGNIPQPATVNQEKHRPPTSVTGQPTPVGELRTPAATTPQQPSAGEARENVKKEFGGFDSKTKSGMFIKLGDLPGHRAAFGDSATKFIEGLKAVESKEQHEDIIKELSYRRVLLQQGVQALRQDLRENAQELRENFRENVKTTIGHVDHGKTGRIAVAHGKGLRMINRYRSAIARFDHILGRMESRVQKIRIEAETRAPNITIVIDINGPELLILLTDIEEAKNMQALNKAKLVELEAKYESLLLDEKAIGYLKIDGIDGKKAYIKIDGVEGEKANGFIKIDGIDGKRTYIESGDIKDEKAIGYLKIDGIDGKKEYGYLKIDGVKGGIYIKIDGIKGDRAYIKLGDLKGEISQGIGEEAREIAKKLKSEIENLHAKLREIATVISGFTTPTYEPEKSFSK